MKHLLRRICDWVVGPGGWLIADDPDDPNLAELRAQGAHIPSIAGPIKDKQGRPAMQGSGDHWHFETGKPWPKHRRPHPLGEDYPE